MPMDRFKEFKILTRIISTCLLLFDKLESKWTISFLSLVLTRVLIDCSAAVEFVQVEIPTALCVNNSAYTDPLRAATALKWVGFSIFT